MFVDKYRKYKKKYLTLKNNEKYKKIGSSQVKLDQYNKYNYDSNSYQYFEFIKNDYDTNGGLMNLLKSIRNNYKDFESNIDDETILNNILLQFENNLLRYLPETPIIGLNNNQYWEINFRISTNDYVNCDTNMTTKNTEIKLKQLTVITPDDYAYVLLFFPTYSQDGSKNYSYLISNILVAYMLKNLKQNIKSNTPDRYGNIPKGTAAKVIIMVTPDVEQYIINVLNLYFDEVKVVPYIAWEDVAVPDVIKNDPSKFIKIQDVTKGSVSANHAYNRVFTKFNIFNKNLFPYKKVVFLDSDLYPLGYFDTLFSLNTPAGWLEHRRNTNGLFGPESWKDDRCHFIQHGNKIPEYLTNLSNKFSSDINASLYVFEPNINTYYEIIQELQRPLEEWFGPGKEFNGFWLGNKKINKYILPEQNYLTQKFSKSGWYSIDKSFCSWNLDLKNCFGFTFAGWISKPWITQSMGQIYSTNIHSEWGKRLNKNNLIQKSEAVSKLNKLLYLMLNDLKNKGYNLFEDKNVGDIMINKYKLEFINYPFDPFEPEFVNFSNIKKRVSIDDITMNKIQKVNFENMHYDEISSLSPDQILILNELYTSETLAKFNKIDYIFTNIVSNYFFPIYFFISYIILRNTINIFKDFHYKYLPVGKTLVSGFLDKQFNYSDDDNDIVLLKNINEFNDDQDEFGYYNLFSEILNKDMIINVFLQEKRLVYQSDLPNSENKNRKLGKYQMFALSKNKEDMLQYCYYPDNKCIDLDELKTLINNENKIIMYFNLTINLQNSEYLFDKYTDNRNYQFKYYWHTKLDYFPKIPWLDVFLGDISNNILAHPNYKSDDDNNSYLRFWTVNKKIKNITNFYQDTFLDFVYDIEMYYPINLNLYLKNYYNLSDQEVLDRYIDKFIIKESHGSNKAKILYTVDKKNILEKKILDDLNNLFKKKINIIKNENLDILT